MLKSDRDANQQRRQQSKDSQRELWLIAAFGWKASALQAQEYLSTRFSQLASSLWQARPSHPTSWFRPGGRLGERMACHSSGGNGCPESNDSAEACGDARARVRVGTERLLGCKAVAVSVAVAVAVAVVADPLKSPARSPAVTECGRCQESYSYCNRGGEGAELMHDFWVRYACRKPAPGKRAENLEAAFVVSVQCAMHSVSASRQSGER